VSDLKFDKQVMILGWGGAQDKPRLHQELGPHTPLATSPDCAYLSSTWV